MKDWTPIFLVAVAAVVVTTWSAALSKVMGVSSTELAAWGQAVGTVAAVGAAIITANRQIRAQEEAGKRARLDLLDAVRDAQEMAFVTFDWVKVPLDQRDQEGVTSAYWQINGQAWHALKRFIALDIDRWPSPYIFMRATAFDQALDQFSTALSALDMSGPPSELRWKDAFKKRAKFDREYGLLRKAIENAIERI